MAARHPCFLEFHKVSGLFVVFFTCQKRNRSKIREVVEIMMLKSFTDPANVCVSIFLIVPKRKNRNHLDSLSFWNWKTDLQKRNSKNHLNSLTFWEYCFLWFLTKILTRRFVDCVSLANMNSQPLSLAQRLEKGGQLAWLWPLASKLNNCFVFSHLFNLSCLFLSPSSFREAKSS